MVRIVCVSRRYLWVWASALRIKKIPEEYQDGIFFSDYRRADHAGLHLQIENYGRIWDVENHESAINYLEVGQEVTVRYGYEVTPGNITWMDGCVCNLSDWEADDVSMSFSAKDKLSDLSEKFYGGLFRSQGISLYDLAVEVLDDAGLDERQYDLDEYLKNIAVYSDIYYLCAAHGVVHIKIGWNRLVPDHPFFIPKNPPRSTNR